MGKRRRKEEDQKFLGSGGLFHTRPSDGVLVVVVYYVPDDAVEVNFPLLNAFQLDYYKDAVR